MTRLTKPRALALAAALACASTFLLRGRLDGQTTFTQPLNNATSTLASAHASGSGTLVLASGTGSRFGSPSPSSPIRVTVMVKSTLSNGGNGPNTLHTIFLCTSRSGDTLSGLTAVEGTSDRNFTAGDPVGAYQTAGMLTEVQGAFSTTVQETGSYADPSFISSIGAAKISGVGSGLLVRGGPAPNAFEATAGAGSWQYTEPIMVAPFSNSTAVSSSDSAYQTMDLSSWAPVGTTSVLVRLQLFSNSLGSSPGYINLRPVGSTKDNPGDAGAGGLLWNDGALVRHAGTMSTGYSSAANYEIPVTPDRKLQYQRVVNGGSHYFYFQLLGWRVRSGLVVGPPQVVVGQASGKYPSFPWAYRDSASNVHVFYLDSPDPNTLPAGHSSNKTAWYLRNGGSPSVLFTLAQLDCTDASDAWGFEVGSSTTLHAIVRQDDATHYGHMHAASTDRGLTWSAPALITPPADFPGVWAFFDFGPSADGTKLYATAYGESSHNAADWSVALLQTSDGVNWTRKSWIHQYSSDNKALSEAGFIRASTGRIVIPIRPPANGQAGYTCYSDDEGETWTTVAQQATGIWNAPRGVALSSKRLAIYGRWIGGISYNPAQSMAYWIADQGGTVLSGPHHLGRLYNASDGAYGKLVPGDDGYEYWGYTDLNDSTAAGPNLVKRHVQLIYP